MELTLEQMLAQANGAPTEEPPVEEPPVETPPAEEPPVETPPAEEPPKPDPKPNPIKELRDTLAKEKAAKEKIFNAVKRFTDGDYELKLKDFKNEKGDIDYDALVQALDEEDNKRTAATKGISPEVQKEIDRIEREKAELDKEKLKVRMDKEMNVLQLEQGLKPADINNFFKDAMTLEKNPFQWLAQGGVLQDLYFLVYREKIMKAEIAKAVEEEKAKWDKRQTPPAPNPANPKGDPGADKDGMTLAELLAAASKK